MIVNAKEQFYLAPLGYISSLKNANVTLNDN